MHAQWSVADGDWCVVSDISMGDKFDDDDEAAGSEEEEDPRSWLFHVYPTVAGSFASETVKVQLRRLVSFRFSNPKSQRMLQC